MNDSEVLRSYKIKLYPTEKQKDRLIELMHLYRYCYNWALSKEKESYESGKGFIERFELNKLFAEYRAWSEDEWIKTIPLNTANRALGDLIQAFKLFFKKACRYPVYKTKKQYDNMKFSVRGQRLKFFDDGVSIEGMGYGNHIKCVTTYIPHSGESITYYNCRVSYDQDDFWLEVSIKYINPMEYSPQGETIGIDVGVKQLAVLSNGKVYSSPDTLKLEKRMRKQRARYQRDIYRRVNLAKSTKTKYEDISITKNEQKRAKAYRKTVRKINNTHKTFVSQITTEIVNTMPKKIVLEDLFIPSMVTNHYIAESVYKARFRMIHNQIEYKAKDRGIEVVKADRFYPSSQLCSNCGHRQKIGLSRVYKCPNCGLEIDRDLNAAINLSKYGMQT
jgi:putative transposase